jgi:hypothetical protein
MFVSAGTVSAYQGDPSVRGPQYSLERHQAMEKAFETNNFSSWRELMGDRGRVTEKVNKANFSKFSEAHRLAEAGNMTEAEKIRQSLGLDTTGTGSKMSRPSSRGQNHR